MTGWKIGRRVWFIVKNVKALLLFISLFVCVGRNFAYLKLLPHTHESGASSFLRKYMTRQKAAFENYSTQNINIQSLTEEFILRRRRTLIEMS